MNRLPTRPNGCGTHHGPRYKQTGFWFTLGTFIVSGLVLTNVISPTDENQVGAVVNHVIQSVSLVASLASGLKLYKYKEQAKEEKQEEKEKPVPKRTTKPKRKTNSRGRPRKRD